MTTAPSIESQCLNWLDLPDGIHRCQWPGGRDAFVKVRHDAPCSFFETEAVGLATLANAAGLRVPAVLGVAATGIALEDLGSGAPQSGDWECAGRGLAALHRHAGEEFGWDRSGWCGDSAQDNHREHDGFRFFAERRLLPLARRAFDAGLLDRDDVACVERLCSRLREWLPVRPPVLVHGDLWLGNLHACANGELAMVDGGAVHYGWAETDLSMLTLFGQPPIGFFADYESAAAVGPDWRRRAPLLNLYPLLNHLNLFGRAYLAGVRGVLARYA